MLEASRSSLAVSREPRQFVKMDDWKAEDESSDVSDVSEILFNSGKVNTKLAPTAYDGVILAFSCLMDTEYCDQHGSVATLLQFILMLLLHVLSVVTQLFLTSSLLVYDVHPTGKAANEDARAYIMSIETALASSPPQRLPADDDALVSCSSMKTTHYAHDVIIFVWTSKMMNEFFDVWKRVNILWSLVNNADKADHEVTEKDGAISITKLSIQSLIVMLLVVCLPQAFVAFVLFWTGTKFLFYSVRMDVLVMKAVSLGFISQLDELLFAIYSSLGFRCRLEKATYRFTRTVPFRDWHLWGSALLPYVVTAILSTGIVYGVFSEVTHLRELCRKYWVAFPDATPVLGSTSFGTIFLRETFYVFTM